MLSSCFTKITLEELPDELTDCASLEFISLHRNNLSALPDSLNKLIHLKELTISKAGFLVQLPEGLCDLRMLELLEIDGYSVVPMCLLVNKTNRLRIVMK